MKSNQMKPFYRQYLEAFIVCQNEEGVDFTDLDNTLRLPKDTNRKATFFNFISTTFGIGILYHKRRNFFDHNTSKELGLNDAPLDAKVYNERKVLQLEQTRKRRLELYKSFEIVINSCGGCRVCIYTNF